MSHVFGFPTKDFSRELIEDFETALGERIECESRLIFTESVILMSWSVMLQTMSLSLFRSWTFSLIRHGKILPKASVHQQRRNLKEREHRGNETSARRKLSNVSCVRRSWPVHRVTAFINDSILEFVHFNVHLVRRVSLKKIRKSSHGFRAHDWLPNAFFALNAQGLSRSLKTWSFACMECPKSFGACSLVVWCIGNKGHSLRS